ncbi:hypothetical protein PTTG_10782 [Puccinia triticina 1-1 BBBD Race 1]|uniref:Myb_DNA-bind_3 domain-containing protein n=1 Tax=Puccinia triticina (isolate 1-1 / race 1 (BBBD)) TaxID=630390 RepID=A0A180FZ71_PUCT1|nr:hypothetical protein PTTG_10782 [Puccinia triticina 1-1 BBBD Race 1]
MATIPPPSSTANPTSTTPTPMAHSKKIKPTKQTAKPKKLDESEVKTPNHTWTTDQKMSLLESIATQYAAGLETDNGGLKKEAWPIVQQKLNTKYSLTLSLDQIKNQKNALRTLYIDYKFLRDQSGFGWDEDRGTVTADNTVWDDVFSGKSATGEIAKTKLVPTTTEAVKLTPACKRKVVPLSDDDSNSDINIEPQSSLKTAGSNTTKRVRESKIALIKGEMESISSTINAVLESSKNLMGEFAKISSALCTTQPRSNPSTSAIAPSEPNISGIALQLCADQYLGQVFSETYVDFASVLENKSKARTFIALCCTANDEVCQMWLKKKVEEAKNK